MDRTALADPALTGLSRPALDDLVARLATAWNAQREESLHERRGGQRRRAPGAGSRPRLTLADRVLATLLHRHLSISCPLLAQLLGVNRTTISRAIRDTLPLLDQHPSAIPEPATARIHTLADLRAYATARVTTPASEIKPAC